MRTAAMALVAALAASGLLAVSHAQEMADDTLVVIETPAGTFTIELFDDVAPNHAANLRGLADSGYYNGTLFHRIIPDFMIQGGDPNTRGNNQSTWGTGGEAFGPEDTVAAEFNDISHLRGIVSMARSASPDSGSSQFFIVHGSPTFLDGQYTAFGRIVTAESFEALDAIAAMETGESDRPVEPESVRILGAYTIARSEAGELLDQGEPVRTGTDGEEPEAQEPAEADPAMATPAELEDGVYTNKRLGIAFEPPVGWTVTELPTPKPGPEVPDIVVVGPAEDNLPPVITVDIQFAVGRSLDAYITDRNEPRQSAIDSGELVINDAEEAELNGRMAMAQSATGTFVTGGVETEVAFREVIVESSDKFYTFTYMSASGDFEEHLGLFEETLETLSIPSEEAAAEEAAEPTEAAEGGGCLIATAAYGTEMAAEVQALREVRDSTLMRTGAGSAFMAAFNDVYYSFSPTVADWERQSPEFRALVRALITPMLASLSIMSAADADSELSVLSLGAAVIALNLGLYVAAPATLAWRLRR